MVGDYTVMFRVVRRGEEILLPSSIFFDRKSHDDLFGTFGNEENRLRIKERIKESKLNNIDLKIIIECDTTEIMKGHWKAKTPGQSLIRKLETMRRRYDTEFIYCTNRTDMKRKMIERWYAEGMEKIREMKGVK